MSNQLRWAWTIGLLLALGCVPARAQQRTEPQQPGQVAQKKEQQRYPTGITVFGSSAAPSSTAQSKPAAAPSKPAASCPALVDQLMKVSGIDSQISEFPVVFAHQMPDVTHMTPVERRAVQTYFRVAGEAATYRTFIRGRVTQNCDPGMIQAAIHKDQTPLTQQMNRWEILSFKSLTVAQLNHYLAVLRAHPPAQARVELTERFLSVTDAVPIAVQTAIATAEGVRSAIIGRPLTDAEKAQIAQREKQSARKIAQAELVQFLFTFRQASQSQLEQFVALAETWPFPQLSVQFGQATVAAFRYQSDRAAAAALQSRRSGH